VLALVAVSETVVGGAGDQVGIQGTGEVRGLDHDTGLGIKFYLDLDLVAGRDTGGLPIGVAQAEQVPAAHDSDSALPRMPVDRDRHRRPSACTERLHNVSRNFQPSHGLRRLNVGSEIHDVLPPPCQI